MNIIDCHLIISLSIPRLVLTLGVLCCLAPWTRGYSRGAPRATCLSPGHVTNVSLTPRHGFSPQPGPGPARILLDQTTITYTDYIRVTLRSEQAFKVTSWVIIFCKINSALCVYYYIANNSNDLLRTLLTRCEEDVNGNSLNFHDLGVPFRQFFI